MPRFDCFQEASRQLNRTLIGCDLELSRSCKLSPFEDRILKDLAVSMTSAEEFVPRSIFSPPPPAAAYLACLATSKLCSTEMDLFVLEVTGFVLGDTVKSSAFTDQQVTNCFGSKIREEAIERIDLPCSAR